MRAFPRSGFWIAAWLCACTGLFAQHNAVDSLFYKGIAAYEKGAFKEALDLFNLLDELYPAHARTTGSVLMKGKSLYKLKDYSQAVQLFDSLISDYPNSAYRDDALYGLGTSYYRLGRRSDAVVRLLEVIESTEDKPLQAKAAKLSRDIMEMQMDPESLRDLLGSVKGLRGTAAVTLTVAEKEMKARHFNAARSVLEAYLQQYPGSQYGPRMQTMLDQALQSARGMLKIGVILPLTGMHAEEAKEVLEGIRFAVDTYNKSGEVKADLVIEDSRGEVVQSVLVAQKLCRNPEVMALIGELESSITAAVAAVAAEKGMPLLAPLATETGLASIGNSIFQVNSDIKTRASLIADYAVRTLGLRRFALLAPADPYGMAMAESFKASVEASGSEIIAEKWYYEGAENLKTQFQAIREAGIRRMISDSLLVIVPRMQYERALYRSGSAIVVKESIPELVDSTDLAINVIDGIFLPVWQEDLKNIIPQLAYYNLGAQILGGREWDAPEILDENKAYVDGAIFISDYFVDASDYQYNEFKNRYRTELGKSPGKNEIFGYDTASLILEGSRGRLVTRETMTDFLNGITGFKGIHGVCSFNKGRVNPNIRLLRFRAGNISILR